MRAGYRYTYIHTYVRTYILKLVNQFTNTFNKNLFRKRVLFRKFLKFSQYLSRKNNTLNIFDLYQISASFIEIQKVSLPCGFIFDCEISVNFNSDIGIKHSRFHVHTKSGGVPVNNMFSFTPPYHYWIECELFFFVFEAAKRVQKMS